MVLGGTAALAAEAAHHAAPKLIGIDQKEVDFELNLGRRLFEQSRLLLQQIDLGR